MSENEIINSIDDSEISEENKSSWVAKMYINQLGVTWVPAAWTMSPTGVDSSVRMTISVIRRFLWLIIIAFFIAIIIGLWNLFKKAWRKGWESIIPFYNFFVLWNIAWLEKYVRAPAIVLIWWFVSWLDVIPYFDSIYEIFSTAVFAIMNFFVAKKFWWWTLGSILCIFFSWICYMIIWFWNSVYQLEASKEWIN